jgi:GrpB-like predicted nucleotidyltransferase (UPF0157 family)
MSERIVIVNSDPRWPLLFAHEEARVRAALGSNVLQIEHAGSTSVPEASHRHRPRRCQLR